MNEEDVLTLLKDASHHKACTELHEDVLSSVCCLRSHVGGLSVCLSVCQLNQLLIAKHLQLQQLAALSRHADVPPLVDSCVFVTSCSLHQHLSSDQCLISALIFCTCAGEGDDPGAHRRITGPIKGFSWTLLTIRDKLQTDYLSK